MRKRILLIALALVAGGLYLDSYRLARTECIPIKSSFFRWDDRVRRDNIKRAMGAIHENSPEDYERVCTRATSIQLVRFEDQLVPDVPTDSLGSYMPNQKDISAKGVINIDREAALGYPSDLEAVLVHEACHAFLIQTVGDFSQEPCFSRAQIYLLARPKPPLEERSAEMQERAGMKFHTYCSSRNSSAKEIRGECVFINYTTEPVTMCAKVFLKKAELRVGEKDICKKIDPVGYGIAMFELLYPRGAKNTDGYQIGFTADQAE